MEKDSKEGIKMTNSPEKIAAVKAVKDAFGLNDDETPPPSLFERLKGKGTKQQSLLRFQKKILILDPQTWMMTSWRQWWLFATSKL